MCFSGLMWRTLERPSVVHGEIVAAAIALLQFWARQRPAGAGDLAEAIRAHGDAHTRAALLRMRVGVGDAPASLQIPMASDTRTALSVHLSHIGDARFP
jgi:hypothetical protein